MTSRVIESTALWKRTLAPRDDDEDGEERSRLRSAFWAMRENVIPFVEAIHRDVPGLTVHDETHLDALWQTADLICGDGFKLTPTEAFVFGASVLLHDTAMALTAYPGGIRELQDLQIWKDVEAQYGGDNEERVQFIVLRELHAQQAEELARISFRRKGKNENLFLLEDTKLRDSLADQIGRIAHSHHWDQRDLLEKLNKATGGVPGFPTEWGVNEIKVAALLRCADAAHIDSRRAPTFLYAISEIHGVSGEHWNFQNKLNQPTLDSDKLVFNSGSDFALGDAASWWICHDTLRMIDQEIKGCNAILADEAGQEFAAKSVKGIESPKLLASYIRVKGWMPVDAEVRVSDPVHLAKTLGGENLYGNDALPPVREILQNSVDAIRARRVLEDREDFWGQIRVTIERNDTGEIVLNVDDQGVGMSERVLTGPLIDFGNSFWGSDLARNEFPGLISAGPQTIGKFGIGFFAIFLLGDEVSVASKRYDSGRSSENVLSFSQLSRRPLLRPAVTGEIPRDYSTRVSVVLNESATNKFSKVEDQVADTTNASLLKIEQEIRMLVCALDVDIQYRNDLTGVEWRHDANWAEVDSEVFLEEAGCDPRAQDFSDLCARLSVIKNSQNEIVGRAAFVFEEENNYYKSSPLIAVGGFTSYSNLRGVSSARRMGFHHDSAETYLPGMRGVVVGSTEDASRSFATPEVNTDSISAWATGQAELIDTEHHLDHELVAACIDLMKAGGTVSNLPFAIVGGSFSTWDTIKGMIQTGSAMYVGLRFREYADKFEFRDFSNLGSLYTSRKVRKDLILVNRDSEIEEFDENEVKEIVLNRRYRISARQKADLLKIFELSLINQECEKVWGEANLNLEYIDVTSELVTARPKFDWVLAWTPGNAR